MSGRCTAPVLGIEATNIRAGGGLAHLVGLLAAADPPKHGLPIVHLWGGPSLLARLPTRPWLVLHESGVSSTNVAQWIHWQKHAFSRALGEVEAGIAFVPGGILFGRRPVMVSMAQNLLPFAAREIRNFGIRGLRYLLLRLAQRRTFQSSQGIIFLTEASMRTILRQCPRVSCPTAVVPHGLGENWLRDQQTTGGSRGACLPPRRLLYVSSVSQYKHQWNVVEAVATLRREGLEVELTLAGGGDPASLARLRASMLRHDANGHWCRYLGAVAPEEMPALYRQADVFVFASTCETFGIILLEAMATGLPIACAATPELQEVVGDAAELFDPLNPRDITRAIRRLVLDQTRRLHLAEAGWRRSRHFTWARAADSTFRFIAEVATATPPLHAARAI